LVFLSPSGRKRRIFWPGTAWFFLVAETKHRLRESTEKIAILYDASQAILSSTDLDEALCHFLTLIRDYFQLRSGTVWLFDPVRRDLYVRAHLENSASQEGRRNPLNQGLCGAAACLKRPVYAPDVSRDSRVNTAQAQGSEVAIPLLARDEIMGVLDLQSEKLDHFDSGTIDLLTLLATHASMAVENARVRALHRRRSEQLEAINAVARHTTAVLELDELLAVVCNLLLEWFRADHVAVLLVEGDHLRIRAHQGRLTPRFTPGAMLVPGSGLVALALASGRSLLENDVTGAADYVPGFVETKSEICVPLVFFGEKLGALALDSAQPGAFDSDDQQPLESVADICAAAIHNANHFDRVKQLAYVDGLTGIHNRRFFEMRFVEELERAGRFQGHVSLIMADIDNFKKMNDEFGHLLGDEVLRAVSSILKQQLRKVDVVCRYGGDEFAIVAAETAGEHAVRVAEKLRRQIEAHHFTGVPRPVTISCGVAVYPEDGRTRDEMVAAADRALYFAKQAGRNRVVSATLKKESSTGS
jgi:diguanylate cyclase (GGDEF)-like protein